MSGRERRQAIRRLIAGGRIGSQADLIAALAEQGVAVTQATVSRDLATLGVVRATRDGHPRYLLPDDLVGGEDGAAALRLRRLLRDLPLDIDVAPPLLILRTAPGAANAIASAIDASRMDGAVGTVAGDDTIFVACRSAPALRRLRAALESIRDATVEAVAASPTPPQEIPT